MAYVNVKEWNVDQVNDWLKGLDPVVSPYTKNFLNNEITGEKVLSLTSNDLENLGVTIIGHQELLLEAVQKLRNFHYELDKENLQMLALHLSCEANSLYKELELLDRTASSVPTSIMSGVHNVILKVKPLVTWLMQTPFLRNIEFNSMQRQLLTICFELAVSAHRDRFIENPIATIMIYCHKLTELADYMIQNMTDPLILQPAGLNLTTLRKKEQELGVFIFPNYHLVHQIADFKPGSAAHLSRKLEIGDEIVQVNYQTVVAWQRQNVMLLLRDSPPEVFLTLKKLPRHAKVYGPIYMKPYRLPSKKRGSATTYSRWNENLPSPRLLTINDLPQILEQKPAPVSSILEHDSSSDNDTDPPDSPLDGPRTLYPSRSSKPVLQRRNTISGATPSNNQAYPGIEQFLLMYKPEALHTKSYHHIHSEKFDESTLLRDKSASCSNGLESTKSTLRPTTISGISPSRYRDRNSLRNKRVNFDEPKIKTLQKQVNEDCHLKLPEEKSVSVNSLNSLTGSNAKIDFIDEAEDLTDRSNMGTDKDEEEKMQEFKNVDVHNIIKKFDEKLILQESNPIINNAVRAKIQNRFVSPNETPKNESETKIWEYNNANNNNEKLKTAEKEPIEAVIKYELGIPTIETKNSYMVMSRDIENTTSDVPPKPPPRSLPHDSYKPKYPADSPKPQIDLTKRKPEIVPPPRVEEKSDGLVPQDAKLETADEVRKFEPKMMSTPVKMNKTETESDIGKVGSLSITKSSSSSKVSPTNSIVRGLMSNKGKAAKKKNTLTARKRKVCVADVSPGDWEAYLYQRFRPRDGGVAFWDKLWYVLIGNRLYGFQARDSVKAKVLIYLTGFTVSLASEVKSRTNAFKVYHTGTVFYFSADTKEQMTTWIESISEAILRQDPKPEKSILYSETDDSDSEQPKTPTEKTSEGIKKFGSLKKFTSKKSNDSSHSLDREWFFNKSTSSKNSVPVPTAQFRSYRKTQASTPVESVSTGNFTSHIPNFAAGFTSGQNISVPNLTIEKTEKMYNTSFVPAKNKPKNFNHASNPSLYNLNEFNSSIGMSSVRENFAGCITLEELMKQQKQEQELNPLSNTEPINLDLIKPDVVYGEVPIRPKEKIEVKKKLSPGFESSSFCFGKKKADEDFNVSTYPKSKNPDLQHNRSLPRTHKIHPTYEDPTAKLKPAGQYTPMTLPMTDDKLNPRMGFELNLDERSNRSGRFKNFFHKSSPKAPSPKMGRLMLPNQGEVDLSYQGYNSEGLAKLPEQSCGYTGQHVDYPGLKYPPVFQPETYSLSDPQGFSNLRKQDKNNLFN